MTFIERTAQRIIEAGLTMPAILLIEAHRPLAFLGSQLLLVAQPMLDTFISPDFMGDLAHLLADDAQLEQLVVTLETKRKSGILPDSNNR